MNSAAPERTPDLLKEQDLEKKQVADTQREKGTDYALRIKIKPGFYVHNYHPIHPFTQPVETLEASPTYGHVFLLPSSGSLRAISTWLLLKIFDQSLWRFGEHSQAVLLPPPAPVHYHHLLRRALLPVSCVSLHAQASPFRKNDSILLFHFLNSAVFLFAFFT